MKLNIIIFADKAWRDDSEATWRNDQIYKRSSPSLNVSATITTTTSSTITPVTGPFTASTTVQQNFLSTIPISKSSPDERGTTNLHEQLSTSPGN